MQRGAERLEQVPRRPAGNGWGCALEGQVRNGLYAGGGSQERTPLDVIMIQPAASSPGVDRLGAGEVTDSSCPGSAGEADACGLPQPSRPPGSSYASLLCAVMWRGYNGRSRE